MKAKFLILTISLVALSGKIGIPLLASEKANDKLSKVTGCVRCS